MPGRVDDDVLTSGPLEKGASGIDRHALLLLFQEGVEQKSVFKLFALLFADGLNFSILPSCKVPVSAYKRPNKVDLPWSTLPTMTMFMRSRISTVAGVSVLHVAIFSEDLHASAFVLSATGAFGHVRGA